MHGNGKRLHERQRVEREEGLLVLVLGVGSILVANCEL